MSEDAPAAIDGRPARLVDLSVFGVQLVGQEEMRPKQPVTVTLGAGDTALTTAGTVVWARLELSRQGPELTGPASTSSTRTATRLPRSSRPTRNA